MSTPDSSSSHDDGIDLFIALLPQYDGVLLNSDVVPAPNAAGKPHFQSHEISSLAADIVIRQLPSQGLSFQLWPAASTFLSLLDGYRLSPSTSPLLSSIHPRGRRIRILELGSGTGLVGIGAASILGAEVTVTDLGHVVNNLEFNVTENAKLIAGGGGKVNVAELSWGNADQMAAIGRDFDLVFGSDLVYHDHLYGPLMEMLKYLLLGGERKEEEEEMVFVMAHLKRWKKEAVFFKRAKKLFNVDVIHRDCPSDGKRLGVVVYRFMGKKRRVIASGSDSGLSSGLDSLSGSSSIVGSPDDGIGL